MQFTFVIDFFQPLTDAGEPRERFIDCPDEIKLKNGKDEYNYRLIGVIDKPSRNHFIAKLKLVDGEWYSISDIGDTMPQRVKFDMKNKYHDTILYERIE